MTDRRQAAGAMRRGARGALLATFLLLAFQAGPAGAVEDWVVRESAQSVPETVGRLEAAIERSGSSVIAVFDHQAAAAEVGETLAPATVVLFAKPRSTTGIVAAVPRAAIDLPQRILVWEEGGVTRIGYTPPKALAARHGVEPDHPELSRLQGAVDSLVDAALQREGRSSSREAAAR